MKNSKDTNKSTSKERFLNMLFSVLTKTPLGIILIFVCILAGICLDILFKLAVIKTVFN